MKEQTEKKVVKKRSMSAYESIAKESSVDEEQKYIAGIHETTTEHVLLSSVKLNFRNKRVITQLVRFIPDEVCADALLKEDVSSHVLSQIDKIHRNNIIKEFEKSKDGDEINLYDCHRDLYDTNLEGIFVGKGVCFHNIKTNKPQDQKLFDDFVNLVNIAGASLQENEDVAEKPQVVKVGGQRYSLVFGHQRYCFLIFHHGLKHVYDFNLSKTDAHQDLKIYLENNTKTSENGYEQLSSFYHTARHYPDANVEELQKRLSCGQSQMYKVLPFIKQPELIKVVKANGINLPATPILDALTSVKRSMNQLGIDDDVSLYSFFGKKLSELSSPKVRKASKSVKPVRISIKPTESSLDSLFFGDVREWSELEISEYDLKTPKGIKAYISDLMQELNNKGE
jgi:hypothetical protein